MKELEERKMENEKELKALEDEKRKIKLQKDSIIPIY